MQSYAERVATLTMQDGLRTGTYLWRCMCERNHKKGIAMCVCLKEIIQEG